MTIFTEQDGKVIRTETDTNGNARETEFYASHGHWGHIYERTPGKLIRRQACKGLKGTMGTLYLEQGESLLARIVHEHKEAQRQKAKGKGYVRREFRD